MRKEHIYRFLLPFLILVMAGTLVWWLVYNPVASFSPSIPGMDNRKKGTAATELVKIGDEYTFFREMADVPGTRWPRFRGAGFDNINREKTALIDKWGKEGPKILWKIPLGDGHAAPAVFDGKIYILDYDEAKRSDMLRSFSLETGEELWRRGYHVHLKRNHGLSRTIPAVNEKYVVTIGPRCQVMCVGREKGDILWGIDLVKEYGTEVRFCYTGQCHLMEGDTVILAAGGRSLLIAIDCKTGKKVWETPNPRNWKMSHSSLMPMTWKGRKMYVYVAIGGICGISASGPDRGKILWETTGFAPAVVAPSPVILDKGRIFVSAGYGAGSAVLQLKGEGNRFSVEIIQKYKPLEGLASEQQTPILYNGYLYGIQPKDAGSLRNQFVVYRENDCMKMVAGSGKVARFGLGPYIMADGKFFILNDDGEMTIAGVSPSEFIELDKARIIDGQDSWGPLVVTGGYLLMRDSRQMVCLDIRKNSGSK
ncbi:MAG: PQQ-binding-like beta-propeller repeat protein [bacterium]